MLTTFFPLASDAKTPKVQSTENTRKITLMLPINEEMFSDEIFASPIKI